MRKCKRGVGWCGLGRRHRRTTQFFDSIKDVTRISKHRRMGEGLPPVCTIGRRRPRVVDGAIMRYRSTLKAVEVGDGPAVRASINVNALRLLSAMPNFGKVNFSSWVYRKTFKSSGKIEINIEINISIRPLKESHLYPLAQVFISWENIKYFTKNSSHPFT